MEIAETAHAKEQDLQEAQALRHMAEYQADDNVALEASEAGRGRAQASGTISRLPIAMRNCRAFCATAPCALLAPATSRSPTNHCSSSEAMANGSRNRVIQSSYQGAAGTLFMNQKKYQEAVAHLEEDQDNPFTMELLVQAYYQTCKPTSCTKSKPSSAAPMCRPWSRLWSSLAARAKRPNI